MDCDGEEEGRIGVGVEVVVVVGGTVSWRPTMGGQRPSLDSFAPLPRFVLAELLVTATSAHGRIVQRAAALRGPGSGRGGRPTGRRGGPRTLCLNHQLPSFTRAALSACRRPLLPTNTLVHHALLHEWRKEACPKQERALQPSPVVLCPCFHALHALQVNLLAGDKPGDVYSGVCAIVADSVAKEAARELGPDATEDEKKTKRIAQLVDGLIDRKVVKQTVMTSVYGVTFVGARQQIRNRLEEKLLDSGVPMDEVEELSYQSSHFVAKITMNALKELFTSARNIMDWLGACARIVAADGHPMSWVTPLGKPGDISCF